MAAIVAGGLLLRKRAGVSGIGIVDTLPTQLRAVEKLQDRFLDKMESKYGKWTREIGKDYILLWTEAERDEFWRLMKQEERLRTVINSRHK